MTNNRTVATEPSFFRVAQYPDGRKLIQAGFKYYTTRTNGVVWRDLLVVPVDESGKAVGDSDVSTP